MARGLRQWRCTLLSPNHLGSIVAHSNAAGISQSTYKYGPYGEPTDTNDAPAWSGSRFRFTGQIVLGEAKLYYFKARVYDPAMGRFLQTDPIGAKDDLNLYAYTANDPINGIDPTGTKCAKPTMGSSGQLEVQWCKIEDQDRKRLVKEYGEGAVAGLEASYKDTVNALLAQGGYEDAVTVDTYDENGRWDGNSVSARVSSAEVARNLIEREVVYRPDGQQTKGLIMAASADGKQMIIGGKIGGVIGGSVWYRPSTWLKNYHEGQMTVWGHEGIHSPNVHKQLGPRETWERNHESPFTQAAWRLMFNKH